MNRNRILIVSPFPPLLGGVSVSSERLYNNLKEDGYDVEKYNIIKFGHNPLMKILVFLWIPFYIFFRKRYDIIHFHIPSKARKIYVAFLKPLYKGAKIVFTLHGDVTNLIGDKKTLWALGKADKIICVQKGDTAKLPTQLMVKSKDIPAFIMPKNVTESDIPQDVLAFVKDQSAPLILFYGSIRLKQPLYDLYGIETTLDLCDYLESQKISYRMLLLITYNSNDAGEAKFMENVIRRLDNREHIMLVKTPNFPLIPIYQYSQVYIRPTKTDGDSLAVREAIQMSCTTIASKSAVRPKEVITYSNNDEFNSLVAAAIKKPSINNTSEQPNYYNQIKDLYNETTAH